MDHSYFRDKISAYFDNELSPQEREVIEQHLAQCQECRNLLAELKRLDRTVEKHSQLGGEEYWEQSAQRIEQRLGFTEGTKVTDITPSRWKGLVPKLAAVAASIAVLGFIVLYEGDISKEVSPPIPKTVEPPQVVSKKGAPTLSKEGTYEKMATEDKETNAVTPVDEREAKVAVAQKEEVITPQELPKIQAAKPTPARTVIESVPEKVEVLSPSVDLAVAERGEGGIIAEETISVAKPKIAQEFSEFKTAHADTASTTQKTVSMVVSDTVLPDDWLQPVSLDKWRHRRDSLQTLYAEVTSPHKVLSAAKSRQKESLPPAQQVEKLLLYAYFQIASLTQDDNERSAAIDFLSKYDEPESSCKDLAEKLLKELGVGPK